MELQGPSNKDEMLKLARGNEQKGEIVAGIAGCCVLSDGEWRETVPSQAARQEVIAREERYLRDSRYS